jgi:hypothetical protein
MCAINPPRGVLSAQTSIQFNKLILVKMYYN